MTQLLTAIYNSERQVHVFRLWHSFHSVLLIAPVEKGICNTWWSSDAVWQRRVVWHTYYYIFMISLLKVRGKRSYNQISRSFDAACPIHYLVYCSYDHEDTFASYYHHYIVTLTHWSCISHRSTRFMSYTIHANLWFWFAVWCRFPYITWKLADPLVSGVWSYPRKPLCTAKG